MLIFVIFLYILMVKILKRVYREIVDVGMVIFL